MSKDKSVRVKIDGNGAIKHDGRYIYYKKNKPVTMPLSVVKRIGKEYEVIQKSDVTQAVVTKSEKRAGEVSFEDLPEADLLKEAGFDTIDKVNAASDDDLTEIKGIGNATLKSIREALES